MKEDTLDEQLQVLQGLQWKNKSESLDHLFDKIQEKEQNESMRWMAAASFVAIFSPVPYFMLGNKRNKKSPKFNWNP